MSEDRWVTYNPETNDTNYFKTFEEAHKYLMDEIKEFYYGDEGIPEEITNGEMFIAKITHRSKYTITDYKKDHHVHTDQCPEDCVEEEWGYSDEFEYVGEISLEPLPQPPKEPTT